MRKQLQALSLEFCRRLQNCQVCQCRRRNRQFCMNSRSTTRLSLKKQQPCLRGGLRKELLHFLLSLRRIMEGLPILASI